MKRLFLYPALLLLVTGCALKTATFTDEQAMPLEEGRTDSLSLYISLEYPVRGTGEEALAAITKGILNAAFDLEEEPGTVEETAIRYEENLQDEYFNENEALTGEPADGFFSWEDQVNGYFSGSYRNLVSYMVEYYNFRGGAHGINTMTPVVFDKKTGKVVSEEEFFADGYRAPVTALIQAHLPEALENDDETLGELFEPDLVGPNGLFEVTKEGVTWYYQPYDIAPYYLGVISVTVPWKELKSYVRE